MVFTERAESRREPSDVPWFHREAVDSISSEMREVAGPPSHYRETGCHGLRIHGPVRLPDARQDEYIGDPYISATRSELT